MLGVIYSSIQLPSPSGTKLLDAAINSFLDTVVEDPKPRVLWSLRYSQQFDTSGIHQLDHKPQQSDSLIRFSSTSPDLAFDDSVLGEVMEAWKCISGDEDGFMQFDDREVGAYDDEEGF